MHSVTYNQDLVNPTILVEWIEFKDFYGLTRNHQVTMTHFGQSVFFLPIFKSSYEPKTYPKWHSLYHQIPNSVTFKVLSNEYKTTCSSLVSKSALYKSIPNPILFLFPQIVTHFSLSLLYSARFANSQIETRPRANWRREGQKIWSFNRGVSGVSENEAQRWNLKWRRRGETNGNDDVFVAESGRWLRFNVQEEKELSAAKFHWPRTEQGDKLCCYWSKQATTRTRSFWYYLA